MHFSLRDRSPTRFNLPLSALLSLGVLLLMVVALDHTSVPRTTPLEFNLPRLTPPTAYSHDRSAAPIRVGLRADAHGELSQIELGSKNLGGDDAVFVRLSREIRRIVHRAGSPLPSDIAVEIDADAELQYKCVIRAVSACTGEIDPQTQTLVRTVEKITFTSLREPITRD